MVGAPVAGMMKNELAMATLMRSEIRDVFRKNRTS